MRPTTSSSGCSRRTRTPTGPSRPPRPASTRATARSPSRSPTGRCSASGRSTTGSRRWASGRCESSTRQSALRSALGAYQLAYLDRVAVHAAVNESVELVRAARLERAVAFTNAVMRRLAAGLRDLLDALPEGPLKHSYPDWIWETWRRDWGEAEALALMRAQNEAPETVVRLVRGEIDGEPTDVPGAYRVPRVDEQALAEGRIWPQSRASQLAGLAVGVAGRGARARPLRRPRREGDDARGRGRGRRAPRGPCAGAGGERAPARRRRTSASSTRTRSRSRPSWPASTGRSSTRPARGSASSRAGLTSAGGRSRSRTSSSRCSAPPPSACGLAARSSTRSAPSTRTRTRRSSTRRASRSRTSAPSGRSTAIPSAPSSSSRRRTGTARPDSSSRGSSDA